MESLAGIENPSYVKLSAYKDKKGRKKIYVENGGQETSGWKYPHEHWGQFIEIIGEDDDGQPIKSYKKLRAFFREVFEKEVYPKFTGRQWSADKIKPVGEMSAKTPDAQKAPYTQFLAQYKSKFNKDGYDALKDNLPKTSSWFMSNYPNHIEQFCSDLKTFATGLLNADNVEIDVYVTHTAEGKQICLKEREVSDFPFDTQDDVVGDEEVDDLPF